MQRAVPEQKLGVNFMYSISQQFIFIKLTDKSQSSLARRAGIKNYDRIISLNGVNVENDTLDQFMNRFESERHLPVQMLVCGPARYEHYKASKTLLYSYFSTIQQLEPVYATSSN
jgi:predicted metalloprotease with PDZ domain